ncbi:hypothetical protein N781_06490 [Pontibacillus halophilus JSM 076056 = DSM 19796]|uniref:Uncharacterized protein n=1 Tax=Pontibacillus halophilus JSM 076056 = DSM 19796 TaxID=1385510 RepID=A0A0A5GI07_9BACI|nr:hypothetical protein N781_06490 [Pontibacillus halophilus JSM 076056 = DSM 19796]
MKLFLFIPNSFTIRGIIAQLYGFIYHILKMHERTEREFTT